MTTKTSRYTLLLAIVGLTLGLGLNLNACKQSEGEVCQITSDCGSNLVCNAATGKCQSTSGGGGVPDAAPPIDAAPDAPVDAAPDAPPDAAIDAPAAN